MTSSSNARARLAISWPICPIPISPSVLPGSAVPQERHRLLLVELPGAREAVGLDEAARQAEDQRQREVARRRLDHVRDVRHRDAALGGGVDVDDVRVHRHHREAAEIGVRVEDVGVDRDVPEHVHVVAAPEPGLELVPADHPLGVEDLDLGMLLEHLQRHVHDGLYHEDTRLHFGTPLVELGTLIVRVSLTRRPATGPPPAARSGRSAARRCRRPPCAPSPRRRRSPAPSTAGASPCRTAGRCPGRRCPRRP